MLRYVRWDEARPKNGNLRVKCGLDEKFPEGRPYVDNMHDVWSREGE